MATKQVRGAGAVATTGVIAASFLAGGVASAVLVAGATKALQNSAQPTPTSANLSNVDQPRYADD